MIVNYSIFGGASIKLPLLADLNLKEGFELKIQRKNGILFVESYKVIEKFVGRRKVLQL